MKIDTIQIQNFRCFKNYEILFGKEITVLIGKNGSGKTNLITVIKKGMSFMFAKSQGFKKSLSEINNCNVRAFNLWDTRFDDFERTFKFPTKVDYKASFEKETINWTFLKKGDPGSLHPTLYSDALNKILTFYNNDISNSELPVLAFFSDSYPHIISKVGKKAASVIKKDILPREFAYYAWDEETNCAELWQRRYIKIYNAINDIKNDIEEIKDKIGFYETLIGNKDDYDKDKISDWEEKRESLQTELNAIKATSVTDEFSEELNFIDNRILSFTKPIRDEYSFINKEFQIRKVLVNRPDRKTASIKLSFSNGKSMFFESLPQGYKRLLSIVLDISYRSFVLNGIKEPHGIVFIDEIELHLHPALQQEVLERFHIAFPNIQFIVSTHSPLVISNLNTDGVINKTIKLENEGLEYFNSTVENIYGIDYTTNLMEVMNANYRPSTIDKLINAYLVLKGKNKNDEANVVFDKLKEYLGGNISDILQKEINNKLKAYE